MFGDTGSASEEGYHTLGKLKCYGIVSVPWMLDQKPQVKVIIIIIIIIIQNFIHRFKK